MKLINLPVKVKLTVSFGLLVLVVLTSSLLALKALNDSNERFSGYVSGINARAEMAASLRASVDDRAMAVRNLVLVATPADVDAEKRLSPMRNRPSKADWRNSTRWLLSLRI